MPEHILALFHSDGNTLLPDSPLSRFFWLDISAETQTVASDYYQKLSVNSPVNN
jgi:hypothetical protein